MSESKLYMFGNKEVFEKRLKEGYRDVAFGRGIYIDNQKISVIWAFYHPDKKIATYEHPKSFDPFLGLSKMGSPFEEEYSEEKFKEYTENKKITLSNKIDLEDVVEKWDIYSHFLKLKLNHE